LFVQERRVGLLKFSNRRRLQLSQLEIRRRDTALKLYLSLFVNPHSFRIKTTNGKRWTRNRQSIVLY